MRQARRGSFGEGLRLSELLVSSVDWLTKKLRPSIYEGSGEGELSWRQGVDGQGVGDSDNDTVPRKRGVFKEQIFLVIL